MDIQFDSIEGNSWTYRTTLIVLAAFAVIGFLATLYVIEKGIWVTGMTNRIPWGVQIVMAVYYIGLSAGSLVISGLYGVFGKLEYKPFARIAVWIAMLFLIAGLLSILTDQGRMDRVFIQPFVHFNLQSMFSINPLLYSGHILICIIYLWALFTERPKTTKVVATLAFGWAFCVHSGTGAIFGFGARMLYESPLLPAAFVAAAMASGTALMIITIFFLFRITNRHVDDALILWLGRFLAITLLVVLYFLFMENAYRVYVVELREAALYYLFGGWHAILFWVGLILIGCCIPMFLLFRGKTGNSCPMGSDRIHYGGFRHSMRALCDRAARSDASARDVSRHAGYRNGGARRLCSLFHGIRRDPAGIGSFWSDRLSFFMGPESVQTAPP